MKKVECPNCGTTKDVRYWIFPGFGNAEVPICRTCFEDLKTSMGAKGETLPEFDDMLDHPRSEA
jgi:NAD-dependent SIR2 family protein deacetylase